MKKLMEKALKRAMGSKKENGKKGLKGFTLVEIIVVLVILAILAAAMIPALTGYIDKAKDKTAISEARSALTALQTYASEDYATGTLFNQNREEITDSNKSSVTGYTLSPTDLAKAISLAELDANSVKDETINLNGKVTSFTYDNGTKKVTYANNTFTVVEQ